jgi:hypothetical protein
MKSLNCLSDTPNLASKAWAVFFATTFAALFLVAQPAFSLVELKAAYSMFSVSPSGLNDNFAGQPKISEMQALSFDVMGNVPLMPVGLGVRHEMFSRKESSGSLNSEVDWKRTSILVNKRFIDMGIYLGPIATVSFASDFKYKSATGSTRTDYKTEGTLTATAGLEAGFKLALLSAGIEAGYLHAPMGNLRDSAGVEVVGSNGSKINVDLSGTYVRATVGFGF